MRLSVFSLSLFRKKNSSYHYCPDPEHANDVENISDAAKWGWRLTAIATVQGPEISVGTAVVVNNTKQKPNHAMFGVVGTVMKLVDRSDDLKCKDIAVKWRGHDTIKTLHYGAGVYDVRPLFTSINPGSVLVPGDCAVLSITPATEADVLGRVQEIKSIYNGDSLANMMNMADIDTSPLAGNELVFVDISPRGRRSESKYPFNSYYKVCLCVYVSTHIIRCVY